MSIQVHQAMVLAAGRGERMRPLTDEMPKPMIDIAGRTMIDRALDKLARAGVTTAVVNTSYKAQMLEEHLSGRRDLQIQFSREEKALETGGGVAKALPFFGHQPFFVVNGDVIWLDAKTSALSRLADFWSEGLGALLLLHPRERAVGFNGPGDFFLDDNGIPSRRGTAATAPYVYTGVQLLHPRLFADAPTGAFSLNVLFDKAIAKSCLKAIVHEGEWLHVGDLEGKALAEARLGNQ